MHIIVFDHPWRFLMQFKLNINKLKLILMTKKQNKNSYVVLSRLIFVNFSTELYFKLSSLTLNKWKYFGPQIIIWQVSNLIVIQNQKSIIINWDRIPRFHWYVEHVCFKHVYFHCISASTINIKHRLMKSAKHVCSYHGYLIC